MSNNNAMRRSDAADVIRPVKPSSVLDFFRRGLSPERKAPSRPPFDELFRTFYEAKDLSDSRMRHYQVLGRMIHRYEAYVRATSPDRRNWSFDVDTVDLDVLNGLKEYLKDEGVHLASCPGLLEQLAEDRGFVPRSDNYLHSTFKMLKAFFNWCIRFGYLEKNPFDGFALPKEEYGTPVILTLDEVERLYNHPMPRKRMERARDVFVFQCMVGARVGDMMRFTKRSVQRGTLEYIAGKTMHFSGRTVTVPLNEIAKDIVRKYRDLPGDRLLPFVSEQNYNSRIKEIFTVAGLTRLVTEYDPVTRTEVKRPLNRIASSHLARRTFVGNIYRKVKDPNLVSALSGHAEGSKAFARYREIDLKMKKDLVRILENRKRKSRGGEE